MTLNKGDKENMKKIKSIDFLLENGERIGMPYKCFQLFKFNLNKNKCIDYMECKITDKGMYYGICKNKDMHPIDRLNVFNDIEYVRFVYKDNCDEDVYPILWNEFEGENLNQSVSKESYKQLYIHIRKTAPYVRKYSIFEIFDFPIGTQFKTKDGEIITISGDGNSKYIPNKHLEEKYINMDYAKL